MQLDVNKIIESSSTHPLVKKVIRKLRREQYFTPGEFFRKLTDHDSDIISEWTSVITDDEMPESEKADEYQQTILMSQLLAMAEGVYIDDPEDYVRVIKKFSVMATANMLHRKNMAFCYYDNLSFGEDYDDKVVLKRLDDE